MIQIRIASIDDAKDIVAIHLSGIEKWYIWRDGEKIEATYRETTQLDRFLMGGPWMNLDTCMRHIRYLLQYGHYPLIAIYDGKSVGELELLIGYEKGLGKIAYIDILEVHRDYRRKGIGKKLVNSAIEIAREKGCRLICVWPAKEAVGFYHRCGFRDTLYNIINITVELNSVDEEHGQEYSIEPYTGEEIKKMWFLTPRIYVSEIAYLKYNVFRDKIIESIINRYGGYIPDLDFIFILSRDPINNKMARLVLWAKYIERLRDIFRCIFSMAKERYDTLNIIIEKRIYEENIMNKYKHSINGTEVLLSHKLSGKENQ